MTVCSIKRDPRCTLCFVPVGKPDCRDYFCGFPFDKMDGSHDIKGKVRWFCTGKSVYRARGVLARKLFFLSVLNLFHFHFMPLNWAQGALISLCHSELFYCCEVLKSTIINNSWPYHPYLFSITLSFSGYDGETGIKLDLRWYLKGLKQS